MADEYKATIKLADGFSAPAKSATAAAEGLAKAEEHVAAATQHAASSMAAAAVAMERATAGRQRTIERLARMRSMGLGAHRASLAAASSVISGRSAAMDQADERGLLSSVSHGLEGAWSRLVRWNEAQGESIDKWKKFTSALSGTPLGMLGSGLSNIAGLLWDIGSAAASAALTLAKVGAAAAVISAGWLTKKVVEAAAFDEGNKLSFKMLTGSQEQGDNWYRTALGTRKDLGLNLHDTIDSYKGLRAAQFDLEKSDALVRMSADLVSVTGHADAARRSILAITQIKGAGRLQGDELNQLAEAGVSRDLVYQQLEKSLKTNRAGVLKKQSAGQIEADVAIDAVMAAVQQKLHTKNHGDAARDFSKGTLGGLWSRLTNAPDAMMLSVARMTNTGPAREAIKQLSDALDNINPRPLADFVTVVLQGINKALPAAIGFAEGFVDGLAHITRALSIGGAANAAYARSSGREFAEFIGSVVQGGKELASALPEAWAEFKKGLGTSSLAEAIKTIDWASLGQDFVVIARALGEIAGAAASVARFVLPDTEEEKQRKLDILKGMQLSIFQDEPKPKPSAPQPYTGLPWSESYSKADGTNQKDPLKFTDPNATRIEGGVDVHVKVTTEGDVKSVSAKPRKGSISVRTSVDAGPALVGSWG